MRERLGKCLGDLSALAAAPCHLHVGPAYVWEEKAFLGVKLDLGCARWAERRKADNGNREGKGWSRMRVSEFLLLLLTGVQPPCWACGPCFCSGAWRLHARRC